METALGFLCTISGVVSRSDVDNRNSNDNARANQRANDRQVVSSRATIPTDGRNSLTVTQRYCDRSPDVHGLDANWEGRQDDTPMDIQGVTMRKLQAHMVYCCWTPLSWGGAPYPNYAGHQSYSGV